MARRIHIDNGDGLALCGLRERPGEERGYFGDNPDHPGSVIEGAVYEVKVEAVDSYYSACQVRDRCQRCAKKWKKLNNID